MDHSDNTAANLLLDRLGGPHGLRSALRALGDRTTHSDRAEPDVNDARPGDVRDMSTPRALAADLTSSSCGPRRVRPSCLPSCRTAVPGDDRSGDALIADATRAVVGVLRS